MLDVDTQQLGALTVLTADGVAERLDSAWAERPAVLVWLRHFG